MCGKLKLDLCGIGMAENVRKGFLNDAVKDNVHIFRQRNIRIRQFCLAGNAKTVQLVALRFYGGSEPKVFENIGPKCRADSFYCPDP